MTPSGQNGHRMGQEAALADATVEDLLAGRHQGDAPVAVSQLVERVPSLADGPAPPPSTAVARILMQAPAEGGP
jgi:hypothetical protein